jgi:hypothetical protein
MSMKIFDPWSGARIKALVGHYGSGKTEIALKLALMAAGAGRRVSVVDLDIVNPFFRSAEQAEALKAQGVGLIAPPYALTGVDLPVLPAEVQSVFDDDSLYAVLDVGGEEAGAAALGRYGPHLARARCDLYYVVNVFRPFSQTADEIIAQMARISARARLAVYGLINNANMGDLTQPEDIERGRSVLAEVTKRTGLPVVALAGEARVLAGLGDFPEPAIPLEPMLRPEWMRG